MAGVRLTAPLLFCGLPLPAVSIISSILILYLFNRFWDIKFGRPYLVFIALGVTWGILLQVLTMFFWLILKHTGAISLAAPFHQEALVLDGAGIILILQIVVFAPLVEETGFRRIILGHMLSEHNLKIAVVGQAVFFAFLHINVFLLVLAVLFRDAEFLLLAVYPINIINAFLLGLLCGYLYLQTLNLWAPLTAHISYNALAVIIFIVFN